MSERYSFSLTTFSPSGKLVQIEYAIAAVGAGAPSIGIKSKTGVVLAAEKKTKSILYDDTTITKVIYRVTLLWSPGSTSTTLSL